MENLVPGEARGERMGLVAVGGSEKPLLFFFLWLKILADARLYQGSHDRGQCQYCNTISSVNAFECQSHCAQLWLLHYQKDTVKIVPREAGSVMSRKVISERREISAEKRAMKGM